MKFLTLNSNGVAAIMNGSPAQYTHTYTHSLCAYKLVGNLFHVEKLFVCYNL